MARLMVSVVDRAEALEAVKGGADIVDVKNPAEGALGAQKPWIVKQVKESLPKPLEFSVTLGDLPYIPGTASLAAVGAAVLGANYVKVGLLGARRLEEAARMVKAVKTSMEALNLKAKIVACGYADHAEYGSLSPLLLPKAAYKGEADGILIDVKSKNSSRNLFSYLTSGNLRKVVAEAQGLGLFAALAGGLSLKTLAECVRLGADVVGLRRGVLSAEGRISRGLVAKAASLVHGEL
ncbi:MAG: hypothetical protein AYL30_002150 [Candidatus Hecatellales archaeon B24]|nr:MAG: hypothetical protein AYL30_002150 [Candidatus Hecatellales archaeon B24]